MIRLTYGAFAMLKLKDKEKKTTKKKKNVTKNDFQKVFYTILMSLINGIVQSLLYGWFRNTIYTTNKTLSLTFSFLESTKRFDNPLFWVTPSLWHAIHLFFYFRKGNKIFNS